jgi:hypothetical protein
MPKEVEVPPIEVADVASTLQPSDDESALHVVAPARPDEMSEFALRFRNVSHFVQWLSERGHETVVVRKMFHQVAGAYDGYRLATDGREWECYAYSSVTTWRSLEGRMAAIADAFKPESKPNDVHSLMTFFTYGNVRCLEDAGRSPGSPATTAGQAGRGERGVHPE